MKRVALISVFLFSGLFAEAQYKTGHQKRFSTDIFPLPPRYRLSGWCFGAGATKVYGWTPVDRSFEIGDSLFLYHISRKNGFGLYADFGRYKAFKEPRWIFHFMDYGLAYKWFKGSESFNGSIQPNYLSSFLPYSGDGHFSTHRLSAYIKGSHFHSISDYWFILHTFGFNVDYILTHGTSSSGKTFDVGNRQLNSSFRAQFHYRFGLGWRASDKVLVVPGIETPFLTVFPFDYGLSGLSYFNSRFRPFLISIKIILLKLENEWCEPPPYHEEAPINWDENKRLHYNGHPSGH